MAGRVRVGEGDAGRLDRKAGDLVDPGVALEVAAPLPFVSRGGEKLAGVLDAFKVDPAGRVCLDVGASTGGFTDCLLHAGARLVVAVDVGYGQLHPRLRQDGRVHVLERTNIRHLEASRLPAVPDLATVDASFISLTLVLPAVRRLMADPFDIVALVKPQFEVGKGQVGKRGVVRDAALHRAALERVVRCATDLGLGVAGMTASPLLGPMGNREFFCHIASGAGGEAPAFIGAALAEAPTREE